MSIPNLEGEIWKDIPDYEGLYQVTNTGMVFSKKRNIFLSPGLSDGYLFVNLYHGLEYERFKVHRLVATMFLENSEIKTLLTTLTKIN